VGVGRPILSKILDQLAPIGVKSPIFGRYSLVVISVQVFVQTDRHTDTHSYRCH